jgi:hypothetical protein
MIGVILFLYIYTTAIGSGSSQFEAEKLNFTTSQEGAARIQTRQEVADSDKSFNLWTNAAQVLFIPSHTDDSISFEVPLDKPGRYELSAVITRGTDYGTFSAMVNGQPVTITYFNTVSNSHKKFMVVKNETQIYDARLTRNNEPSLVDKNDNPKSAISESHVVQRIGLGTVESNEGHVRISLVAKEVKNSDAFIGIDQFMLTYLDGK